jgi:hypothetical protein
MNVRVHMIEMINIQCLSLFYFRYFVLELIRFLDFNETQVDLLLIKTMVELKRFHEILK